MKCLLDMDGVLTDFPAAAKRLFGWSFPDNKFNDMELPHCSGMSIREMDGHLGSDFWANLPWLPTGKAVLSLVENHFGRDNICLFSFPSYNPEGATGKILWIEKNLPDYSQRFLLGTVKYFCASPTNILIDDKERNVCEFKQAGGRSILFPAPWNRLGQIDAIKYLKDCLELML